MRIKLGVVHVLVGEFQHPMRERRREHHIEPLRRMRQAAQNEANVLDEPQIEHAVGFVHDRHLNVHAGRTHVV